MNRKHIIYNMCLTWDHSYGLVKEDDDDLWTSGMKQKDRKLLWEKMSQIFDNDIQPLLSQNNI